MCQKTFLRHAVPGNNSDLKHTSFFLVRGRDKKTVLNLRLGKTSVMKNLNWPDECPTRTFDNIILMHENEQKFKIA